MHRLNRNIGRSTITFLLTAISAAGLSSCKDEDPVPAERGQEIWFGVKKAQGWQDLASRSGKSRTVKALEGEAGSLYLIGEQVVGGRGSSVSSETIESFGVYAAQTDGSSAGSDGLVANYMNNVEITRDNGWAPLAEYHWPTDGQLHINAFSPYTVSASAEGITELPGTDETGGLKLKYTVPEAPANQCDLMWATPVNASSSPCELTFNHALTGIRFVAGAELAPCTVKSIAISGVMGSGTLNIETGAWSEIAGEATYETQPDITLTAATGSNYAEAGTAMMSDDETFMLMPQTLPTGAQVIISLETAAGVETYAADIAGTVWPQGATMVYKVSAGAESTGGLILEVTDENGNPVSELSAPYTGETFTYRVASYYGDGSDGSAREPIEWEATIVDDAGIAVAAMPDWIKDFSQSGSGTTDCTLQTTLAVPVFLAMSDHTRTMRETSDINTTSGKTPYNLASADGGSAIENTANCYVINAPGRYSLPLVYGNAIKNGAENTSAYVSTLTTTTAHNRMSLYKFINHLGNEISSPYIYENSGCSPAGARLVWEERLSTVTDVELSADGKSLTFDVPADFIRQSNAIVAVTDASGTIMWSWHLWLTDYVSGSDLKAVEANGTTGYVYPENLGRIYGGDRTQFSASQARLVIKQKNTPEGIEPLSAEIALSQAGNTITTNDCYVFYQWGRKDPIIAGVESYYDANHRILSGTQIPTMSFGSTHKEMIENSIMNPGKFVSTTEAELRKISPYYCNLWDIDDLVSLPQEMQNENVKTIYDPCPVGAKVPVGNEFRTLSNPQVSADNASVDFTLADGSTLSFLLYGYRQLGGSAVMTNGTGTYWLATSGGDTRTQVFVVNSGRNQIQTNDATYGFGVRPVAE